MRRATMGLIAWGVLVASVLQPARGEITPEAVREAIARGVDYLKRQQRPDGSWTEHTGYVGGTTALCTLALLNSGVEPNEEPIQRALNLLRKLPPDKTYVVALQTMVFCRARHKGDMLLVTRNVKWLEAAQITQGPGKGAWTYGLAGGPAGLGSEGDNSNSQFAILALHEAERAGARVSAQTWRLAKAYWEDAQNPDGSWGYTRRIRGTDRANPGTGSMTCAGITSLVICYDRVHGADAQVDGEQITCCQPGEGDDSRVQRGLKWLGDNFSVSHNPGASLRIWLFYYLYGVERVGRLTAQRFIGKHDWYREGADFLVQLKGASLSDHWKGMGIAEADERIATSFALLFLSKGRWPVLVSKVRHGRDSDWNQHRSDVANLTRFVESRWTRDLIWQVTDLRAASVEDLSGSPVLFLCGANSPLPEAADQQEEFARKIRDYLDRGGFVFAEAYCGGAAFDQGFKRLVEKVFPEPEYRLRLLPPEHPIWRAEEVVEPAQLRPLLGIEFGCRTSVVYCPPPGPGEPVRPSLSCLWELSRAGREVKYAQAVQAQIKGALAIGINVLAYATNRGQLEFQDARLGRTAEDKRAQGLDRGRLRIASLRHPGGCTAAPRALANLLEAAAQALKIRVDANPIDVPLTDDALFDYHMVFMHGRNAFRLTEAERKQLKLYVQRGGMVFANAICANKAFSESFRREMQAVFPEEPLKPIGKDDPMLTPAYGGFDLSTVTRRDPQQRTRNEPLKALLRKAPPELEAIKVNGRYGVIFSPLDLSCALEKQDTMECQGYVREDAARIGLNVVLYSLHP